VCGSCRDELLQCFDVNVVGTHAVVKHLLPFVQQSHEKKVMTLTPRPARSNPQPGGPHGPVPYMLS
jgi:NADP-dependent 3-hydroxy acid dehydrogenase YdfG